MTDYDKNGYNTSDFKRNPNQDDDHDGMDQDGEGTKLNEKAGEYMRELLSEKIKLEAAKYPVSARLIDQEVMRLQQTGRIPPRDAKYVDVYREKPVRVVVKVILPIKEHPKFNFVGKLLGPKGNTMKQLQEETMCKMAVLGRGSMRDKAKEDELRNSLDPKYSHLSDDLHVEISALAPPAEAHARIAYALAEVKKYIMPDTNDPIRQGQMRDMIERGPAEPPRAPLLNRPGPSRPGVQYNRTVTPRSHTYDNPRGGYDEPSRPRIPPRPMPAKSKVLNILDRARSAMVGGYSYDDPYAAAEPPSRGPPPEPDYYGYERSHDRYYEEDYYKEEIPSRDYKPSGRNPSSREVGTRRAPPQRHFQPSRPQPYSRPK